MEASNVHYVLVEEIFTGGKCQSKSDAENGAARQALKHLKPK